MDSFVASPQFVLPQGGATRSPTLYFVGIGWRNRLHQW